MTGSSGRRRSVAFPSPNLPHARPPRAGQQDRARLRNHGAPRQRAVRHRHPQHRCPAPPGSPPATVRAGGLAKGRRVARVDSLSRCASGSKKSDSAHGAETRGARSGGARRPARGPLATRDDSRLEADLFAQGGGIAGEDTVASRKAVFGARRRRMWAQAESATRRCCWSWMADIGRTADPTRHRPGDRDLLSAAPHMPCCLSFSPPVPLDLSNRGAPRHTGRRRWRTRPNRAGDRRGNERVLHLQSPPPRA